MEETSLLYKTEMVQAIIDNIKKMTRRVVLGKTALEWLGPGMFTPEYVADPDNGLSPYGYAGDFLWVKEEHYAYGTWFTEGYTKTGRRKWRFHDRADNDHPICFFDNKPERVNRYQSGMLGYHKRNSLFLPKKFSRIWLKVISVRVERLQDISERDAKAEGVTLAASPLALGEDGTDTYRDAFFRLWNHINADRGYGLATNPWVWVVEFERTEKPQAAEEANHE
jgi:hypothetical protein